jgi:hypothetical protein
MSPSLAPALLFVCMRVSMHGLAAHCASPPKKQPGDDMRSVGDTFQSDWLSLWALNVHLDTFDPVSRLEEGGGEIRKE